MNWFLDIYCTESSDCSSEKETIPEKKVVLKKLGPEVMENKIDT